MYTEFRERMKELLTEAGLSCSVAAEADEIVLEAIAAIHIERLTTVLYLLGQTYEQVDVARRKLAAAILKHPDGGSLTFTHAPQHESSPDPKTSFATVVAIWWQDTEDHGGDFNELVWERNGS